MRLVDVCIVGSGPCGAAVARELAARGLSVVVLEAGPRYDARHDFTNDELAASKLHWPDPRTVAGADPVKPLTAAGIGGTTLIWTACCPRFQPSDFRVRTVDGVADDWPIPVEQIAAYYPRVEYDLSVAGSPRSGMAAHPPNWGAQVLARGCERLGIPVRPGPVAINSAPHEGRPACVYCAFCMEGCIIEAKATAANTYVPRAEALGAQFRPLCFATRVNLDRNQERVEV